LEKAGNIKTPGLPRLTYTAREVQEITGLSPMTIWRKMRSGELKSTKLGGRRLIDAQSLHQLIGVAS